MERHLSRVAAILRLAESKKITDRRTFMQDLQSIYENDEFVKAINIQSAEHFKSPTSWNEIMLTVHRVALSEAERPVGKASRGNAVILSQHGCSVLMQKTVKLATSTSDMSLSCNDIIACVLEVLKRKHLKVYHETYVDILAHHVLTNKMYWLKITGDQWRAILKSIVKLYRGNSDVSKRLLIDTVRLVVQLGCPQSHLLLDVKKSLLPFLEEIFQEVDADKKDILKPLYKLTYTVCQQMGTESRIALCKFSEKILPSIICLEECPEKMNMLLLLMQIDHPGGASFNDNEFCNRDVWRNMIAEIHGNIIRDVKTENLSPCFWKLCCEVYRQIMQDPSCLTEASFDSDDSEEEQPRKRRRLLMAVRKPNDLLFEYDLENSLPFIRILTVLLRKYPDSLKPSDYPAFLKVIVESVAASLKNQPIMDGLCELCTVVIKAEKKYYHQAEQAGSVRLCWEKICDIVLRILSANQNEVQGHELLRSIIEYRNVLDTKEFLHVYLKTQIHWSCSSVETLRTFCSHVQIPNVLTEPNLSVRKENSAIRESLLDWVLKIPSSTLSTAIPAVALANLLTSLAMKFSYKREYRKFRRNWDRVDSQKIAAVEVLESELFDDRESKALSDIERCHLALEFREDLSKNAEKPTKIDANLSTVVVREVFERLIANLSESLANPVTEENVCIVITKVTVAAKLMSNFLELDLQTESLMSALFDAFGETYNNILSQLTTMTNVRSFYLVEGLEALETFYRTRYDCKLARTIVESTAIEFIVHIYNFATEDDEDSENDENCEKINVRDLQTKTKTYRLSDACRVRNSAHKILVHFCCARVNVDGSEIPAMQIKVLNNITKIDIYESTSSADLRRALILLKVVAESEQSSTNDEFLGLATSFLKKLFASRRGDEIAVRGILSVLPDYMKSALILRSSEDQLLEILSETHASILNENYGPSVHADFVKCLEKLIYLKPLLEWKIDETSESTPIIEVLTIYIGSRFYVVRLEVARALRALFSSPNLDVPWKRRFFNKVLSPIADLFIIDELSDVSERSDELAARTATGLHILAAVIRSSSFLHARALHAMIELSTQKDVKTETIKKALESVTKDAADRRLLLQVNLHHLLSRWFAAENPLQTFPWTLLDCDTQENFSRRYIETLLSIKFQRRELREFEILCKNLDVSFARTIEQFFPCIMSLFSAAIDRNSSNPETENYFREKYAKLRSNVEEFSQVEKFEILLQARLPEVVVDIVERLHDREHLFTTLNVNTFIPILKSPKFNAETVNRCLLRLRDELPSENQSLVKYLVTQRPSALQKILQKLFCNVCLAEAPEKEILAFHQYAYFYSSVLQEISLPHFDPMSLYVVKDLVHSLLDFIEEKAAISGMACSYLEMFLREALPARIEEIKEVLSFAVSRLVPIVQAGRVEGAIDVLRRLIIDHTELLASAIEKLDPFPSDADFETVKQLHMDLKYSAGREFSLEDEIEHFLKANREDTPICSLEGLLHIRNQLATRRNELKRMYSKLERSRDFQGDSAANVLHRLVYKLLQLARSSQTEISLAAAKCLGELGPADLSTMVLHGESNGYRREDTGEVETLTFRVISLLAEYLVEKSVDLRRASADGLHAVFSTSWGSEFAEKSTLNAFASLYGAESPTLHERIYPFAKKSGNPSQPIRIDEANWKIFASSSNDLWIPADRESYSQWIVKLTCGCLNCFVNLYAEALKPVCRVSVKFCEMLLPRLLNLATRTEKSLVNDVRQCVDRFFGYIFELIRSSTNSNAPAKSELAPRYEFVGCMLDVVNFMRIQAVDYSPLDFDYLRVAKAAQYSSAWFTSVLYAELCCENLLRDTELLRKSIPGSWTSAIDSICEFDPKTGRLLQEILREAYVRIGEPDSIYGCGLSHLVDPGFKTQHYVHLRQWNKVTLAHDVSLTHGENATRGMLNALQQSGYQFLMRCLINKANKKTENLDDYMYETAWRLADWSILEPQSEIEEANPQIYSRFDYYAAHYRALQSLRDNDMFGLRKALDNARNNIVQSLRNTSFESSQTLYPMLSRLQMLQEIEELSTSKQEKYERLISEWTQEDFRDIYDFQHVEPILTQRLVMYQMRNSADNAVATKLALTNTQLKIAEIAEAQDHLSIAYRVLGTLAKRADLSDSARDQLNYRNALLDWKEKDHYMGRLVLRNLMKKSCSDESLNAKALCVYGNWMAETTSESSQDIIDKYYKPSIKMSTKVNDLNTLMNAQADLAQFADAQYRQIVEFTKTPQYHSLVEFSKLKCEKLNSRAKSTASKDLQRAIVMYQRQEAIDAAELEDINADKEMYLLLAARHYLITLAIGNNYDLLVYRMVSLWLGNMFHEDFNKIVKDCMPRVESHKFIALLPQLATHVSNASRTFTANIKGFMERCAKEHPHHTLPILLALKNSHRDNEFDPPTTVAQKQSMTQSEHRVLAADALISKLSKSNVRPIIREMNQLSHALTSLAYYKVPESQTKKPGTCHSIPRNQAIMKIRDFRHTIVPTAMLDVRPSGNYENIVGIRKYEESFDLLDGAKAPKKITCVDSSGIRRRELLKSQYDLKRDAVIQQFTTAMNLMLKATQETKRRRLRIRTYKVVSLSQRSGVVEWCQNAQAMSQILCNTGSSPGMHKKYYPNDWSEAKCKAKLRQVYKSSHDDKLKAFLECCENLHPAFHHYFTEKYPSAETWFEKRLAYVRSVATTSMIGYMLGIGDRSCKNILIDQTTAEVIHVDFGVAFAEGKVSPTPETVPFRLTRDMEVAMGVCGVEGVMKRSCEQTATVLRERRKTLITLLQVLLYDPLFKWTLIPVEADEQRARGSIQDRADEIKTNKVAERALLKIEQRLEGMEDGLTSSISGQVERLIQEARDPEKLCRMFYDWQPYL